MAKAYWIAGYRSINNPEAQAEYGKTAAPVVQAAGGKILSRDGRMQKCEGEKKERTVLIEFASFDAAVAAYNSDTYQNALAKLAGGAVDRDIWIVEGVD